MTGQVSFMLKAKESLKSRSFFCISEFLLHEFGSAQTGYHQADFFVGYFGRKDILQRRGPGGAESATCCFDD
jgi:hypothetical protein